MFIRFLTIVHYFSTLGDFFESDLVFYPRKMETNYQIEFCSHICKHDETVIFFLLIQIYEYWYTTGGYPSILVENNGPSSRLQQLSRPLWPLKMTSTLAIPQFVFSESIVFASENAPLLVNLNFTSFMRVNYDSLTWTAIFK